MIPWPWPHDLDTQTWPRYGRDVIPYQKWSFYVNSFKSYSLNRQTDTHTDWHTHRWTHRQTCRHDETLPLLHTREVNIIYCIFKTSSFWVILVLKFSSLVLYQYIRLLWRLSLLRILTLIAVSLISITPSTKNLFCHCFYLTSTHSKRRGNCLGNVQNCVTILISQGLWLWWGAGAKKSRIWQCKH